MNTAGRAGVVAGALAAAVIPLLVIPAVRAREEPPPRPGQFAFCPLEEMGGGSSLLVVPRPIEAAREQALRQDVPLDGGAARFEGTGSGTGTGPVVGPGPGTGLPGTTIQPGEEFVPPEPTIPPEVVAEEVVEEDDPDKRSAFPWPLLLLILLLAALAGLALSRRRPPPYGAGAADHAAAAPNAPRRRRRAAQPQDDLEARVRAAFVNGLRALDSHGMVPYEQAEAQPSSRIARRLRRETRPAFTTAAVTFDEVVYGRRPATEQDVARIESSFEEVLQ